MDLKLRMFTYPELMFSAMYPQFFQPNCEVVDTNASITVHIQYLKQHFQSVLLLRPSTYVTWMGWLVGVRVPSTAHGLSGNWFSLGSWWGVPDVPASAARVDPCVGVGGPALAKYITEQVGHQRALLVHQWTDRHSSFFRDCRRRDNVNRSALHTTIIPRALSTTSHVPPFQPVLGGKATSDRLTYKPDYLKMNSLSGITRNEHFTW